MARTPSAPGTVTPVGAQKDSEEGTEGGERGLENHTRKREGGFSTLCVMGGGRNGARNGSHVSPRLLEKDTCHRVIGVQNIHRSDPQVACSCQSNIYSAMLTSQSPPASPVPAPVYGFCRKTQAGGLP